MSKPIVVMNSTPIILLQKVGRLGLLNLLYSKVYIPEAVYKEVITDGKSKNDDFISANSFIEIVKVQNVEAKKLFKSNLHEGEVETIMLAMEKGADLCVLDDLLARKYAKNTG
jgi:predicted nucleic acid-binding protein